MHIGKKTFSLIMLLTLTGCLPQGDRFSAFNDFKEAMPNSALEKCMAENPGSTPEDCSLKNCLSSPLTLLGLHDLLLAADKAFKHVGIDYWIDSGTVIGSERFGAHLPWDDDVDLGVFSSDISPEVLQKMADFLQDEGLEFKPIIENKLVQNLVGYQGLYQIGYNKTRFIRLVLSHNPLINPVDLENLWTEYEATKSLVPHLDIFLYEDIGSGNYAYAATHFAKGQMKNRTIKKELLRQNRTISLLGKDFPTVESFKEYGKVVYGTDDLLNYFVISREHSGGCKVLKFRDVRQHKEFLDYLIRYLSFVYDHDAAKKLGISFDAHAARARFGL